MCGMIGNVGGAVIDRTGIERGFGILHTSFEEVGNPGSKVAGVFSFLVGLVAHSQLQTDVGFSPLELPDTSPRRFGPGSSDPRPSNEILLVGLYCHDEIS